MKDQQRERSDQELLNDCFFIIKKCLKANFQIKNQIFGDRRKRKKKKETFFYVIRSLGTFGGRGFWRGRGVREVGAASAGGVRCRMEWPGAWRRDAVRVHGGVRAALCEQQEEGGGHL